MGNENWLLSCQCLSYSIEPWKFDYGAPKKWFTSCSTSCWLKLEWLRKTIVKLDEWISQVRKLGNLLLWKRQKTCWDFQSWNSEVHSVSRLSCKSTCILSCEITKLSQCLARWIEIKAESQSHSSCFDPSSSKREGSNVRQPEKSPWNSDSGPLSGNIKLNNPKRKELEKHLR